MKSLIVVYSYHHNNTMKVAKAIAEILGSEIKTPEEAKNVDLNEYDLVGFGAGIDSGMHYKELLDFASALEKNESSKKCFIFSTSAIINEKKVANDHSKLREILETRNYSVLDEFSCKGFNTNSFLKYFGGMNKTHPDKVDIDYAKVFANNILSEM